MKLLIVGASGLVGSHVLQHALADERVSEIVAPSRRALDEHPKLFAPLVDFEQLPSGTRPETRPYQSEKENRR